MVQIGGLVGIPLKDHIIVGGKNKGFFSFAEKGILPNPYIEYCSNYNSLDITNASTDYEATEVDYNLGMTR